MVSSSSLISSLPEFLTGDQVASYFGAIINRNRFRLFLNSDGKISTALLLYMMDFDYDLFVSYDSVESDKKFYHRAFEIRKGLEDKGLKVLPDNEDDSDERLRSYCMLQLHIEKEIDLSPENKLVFMFKLRPVCASGDPLIFKTSQNNTKTEEIFSLDFTKYENMSANLKELTKNIVVFMEKISNIVTTNEKILVKSDFLMKDKEYEGFLYKWLKDDVGLIPSVAMKYSAYFLQHSVHNKERLAKKLQKNRIFLTTLQVTEEDAEDIFDRLIVENLLSRDFSLSSTSGVANLLPSVVAGSLDSRSALRLMKLRETVHQANTCQAVMTFLHDILSNEQENVPTPEGGVSDAPVSVWTDRNLLLSHEPLALDLFGNVVRLSSSASALLEFGSDEFFIPELMMMAGAHCSRNHSNQNSTVNKSNTNPGGVSSALLEQVLMVICKLCRHGALWDTASEPNMAKLGSAGACELVTTSILRSLPLPSCHLADTALKSIGYLSTGNDRNKSSLAAAGACEVIAELLDSHGSGNGALTLQGFNTIRNISFKNDDVRNACGAAGLPAIIVSLMKSNEANCSDELLERGLGCIQNLSSGSNVTNTPLFLLAGAADYVVHLLKSKAMVNSNLAENACGAVRNLSFGEEQHRATMGKAGACEAVVAVLKRHGDSVPNLAKEGCIATTNLCSKNETNKATIARVGGCELILNLVRKHGDLNNNKFVALEGLYAVKSLLFLASNVSRLKAAGVVDITNKIKAKFSVQDPEIKTLCQDVMLKL